MLFGFNSTVAMECLSNLAGLQNMTKTVSSLGLKMTMGIVPSFVMSVLMIFVIRSPGLVLLFNPLPAILIKRVGLPIIPIIHDGITKMTKQLVRRKSSLSVSKIPPLEFKMSYKTAASLHHLMCAQSVHADRAEKEGRPALKESFETVLPFFNFVSEYLDKYS
jgi:hypothetical protein